MGLLPFHISYGVFSTALDGTRLSVKAAASRAYPQKDGGRSVWLIIDWTISNRVWFLLSDTPFHCGVPGGFSCETIPQLLRYTHILDQIEGSLFSCQAGSQLHFEIFWTFKRLWLVLHQVDVPISTEVVSERNKVWVTTSGLHTQGSTYIAMYDSQKVRCPFTLASERRFCHLAK